MIIHMEKIFKAIKCKKCRKYFKKNEIDGTPTKQITWFFFGFLVGDFNISYIFYKIQI